MAAPVTDNPVIEPSIAQAQAALSSIENIVTLTSQQYQLVSLILMVSYGAFFAFILFFVMSAHNLAPRYRLVPILSAVVMASAGISLLQEFSLWKESYAFVDGAFRPLAENEVFTNAYRYGNWTITVPMVLPFLMLAVLFRGIENFKMFDMVTLLTGGGPGSTTELTSINLKREAFEKWRTGYSSAYAIILFVTVFGLASIYVKALNKVKQR